MGTPRLDALAPSGARLGLAVVSLMRLELRLHAALGKAAKSLVASVGLLHCLLGWFVGLVGWGGLFVEQRVFS